MFDPNQLNLLLAGLGPWGIVIGIGVTILAQWAKRRMDSPKPAPAPAPAPVEPSPAPAPNVPVEPRFPALARLRELLKSLPLKDIIPLILPLILEKKAATSGPVVMYGNVPVPTPPTDPVEDDLVRILHEATAPGK